LAVTAQTDERRIRSFCSYLAHEKGVQVSSMRIFASPKIGAIVQTYISHKALTCTYTTIANEVGSLLAAARFAHASLKAHASAEVTVSTVPVDELVALLHQCLSKGREDAKFRVASKPKAWLDWAQCQQARLAAETALATYNGTDASHRPKLVRDVCLLVLLTGLPPDRVGVYRRLQLGSTLKRTANGFQLDLSEPGLHKTAAIFGPSCTTVTAGVAHAVSALVTVDELTHGNYLFHSPSDRGEPCKPALWCKLVKATFKTYSGVALCPKDCRASFVTWMMDGDHGSDVLQSAAASMRHSSAMQSSAHYDKNKSERVVSAAVRAADEFARRFAM